MTAIAGLVLAAPSALAAPHTTTLHTTATKAATGWTVTPGGAFKSSLNTGTSVIIKDVTSAEPVTCGAAAINGTLQKANQGGFNIGSITSATYGTSTKPCTDAAGTSFTVAGSASTSDPWVFNALGYSPSVDGGQTHFGMADADATADTGIAVTLHGKTKGVSCTATIGGTLSAPAYVRGEYDNGSGLLAIISSFNLMVLSSTCPKITKGNTATLSTSPVSAQVKPVTHGFALSPKQKFVFTS
jgi:hypothetical protein